MSSPAYDVAVYLTTQGYVFGGNADWCVNVGAEPDVPNNTVTVLDQTGGEPLTDELDLLSVKVQVRVKASDYLAGYAKAEALRDLLILTQPLTMNANVYVGWNLESDVWSLGRNDNNRYLIVANYVGIKRRT